MKTWRNCQHPRTIENARKGRLSYGCRLCDEQTIRPGRFIARAARTALAPKLHRHYAVHNCKLGKRIVDALALHDSLDRACYLLLIVHRFSLEEISSELGIETDEVGFRAVTTRRALATTEHQNFYKDWGLVQQLIDEGIPEVEVRDMISITVNGWFKAKQRGDVRV